MSTPRNNEFDAPQMDRRRFLTMLGISATAAGCAGSSWATTSSETAAADASTSAANGTDPSVANPAPTDGSTPATPAATVGAVSAAAPIPGRNLVVVELQGGNDSLAMLQPVGSGRLNDMRPDQVIADEELAAIQNGLGWQPALAGLVGTGVAAVMGVGSDDPSFSHFEMEQRWWRGEPGVARERTTGFLGRLCDQLDDGAPVTGISLSGGPTPALLSDKSVTVGLSDPWGGWFLQEEDTWLDGYRRGLAEMASPMSSAELEALGTDVRIARNERARAGLSDTLRFADSLAGINPENNDKYPYGGLAEQLSLASQMLDADAGLRVVHVGLGGFDTHSGQSWRHPQLMTELNDALVAFIGDIEERGLRESTLIMTTSEFGRRVPSNDGGTDHGAAGTSLLCGPVNPGLYGEMPSLSSLDDGNLTATMRFDDYYATVAEKWFGIPAGEVLAADAEALDGIIV